MIGKCRSLGPRHLGLRAASLPTGRGGGDDRQIAVRWAVASLAAHQPLRCREVSRSLDAAWTGHNPPPLQAENRAGVLRARGSRSDGIGERPLLPSSVHPRPSAAVPYIFRISLPDVRSDMPEW